MPLLVSIFFGFAPMFLFAGFINWLDRYEKEPKALLGAALGTGLDRSDKSRPVRRIRLNGKIPNATPP